MATTKDLKTGLIGRRTARSVFRIAAAFAVVGATIGSAILSKELSASIPDVAAAKTVHVRADAPTADPVPARIMATNEVAADVSEEPEVAAEPEVSSVEPSAGLRVISLDNSSSGMTSWFWVLVLSAVAAMFLPRQFHVSVVENNNVSFVRQASWMFPLQLFLISIFVIPIALAGKILLPASSDPDMYILSLPLFYGHELLALFVYIGGFSAAASMVVISVFSFSIMVSNNLMMPLLLRTRTAKIYAFAVLSDRLLGIRRVIIVVILFLAYTFYKVVSNNFPLVSIGLISFAAILQLAPAVIGGLFWPRASIKGAIAVMTAGFIMLVYHLAIADS